jgi:hypothetical protein
MPFLKALNVLRQDNNKIFLETLNNMANELNFKEVFNPKDPILGYYFLRDFYCKNQTIKFGTIYESIKPTLKDLTKDLNLTTDEINSLPVNNQLDRYDIESYVGKKYIDGEITRGVKNGKENQVLESSICLNHVIFLNLFLAKSGVLGLPKNKPARKKGENIVDVTIKEVFEFINSFLGNMTDEQKANFLGIGKK